jgi:plastocyanin
MNKNFRRPAVLLSAIAVLSLIGIVACQGSPPTVSITDPAPGVEVEAGNITVTIDVSNFNIVQKLGQPAAPGEGHIHFYIDVQPPTTPGEPAFTAPGTYTAAIETSYTWENVAEGSHTVAVQLVNNDHTPLEPAAVDEVTITVVPPGTIPHVTIDLTAQGLAFDKSQMTVPIGATVTINFNNLDSVQHNFALYQTSAATDPIFVGEIIAGPDTITYQFTAPSTPGTYFFRCDLHPTTMTGDFMVEEGT